MSKKKVLITGTCGFVFGNFIRKAIYEKLPYIFTSIDRVSFNAINSMYWNKNHIFHIGDVTDQHIIDVIFQFEQPDIVIHGAANTSNNLTLINTNEFINSNILGTQTIINACVKHKVDRLIYVSTDEVYGQLTSEKDISWTEDMPLNPRSPYAASKAAGELLVKAAHESYGLNYNITRSSNNYGPRQTTEKLIPKTIQCIFQDKKIPIYDQGLQIRDWIHVFDNCSAIMTILEKGQPNEVYNISANQELTNIDVVQKICNALGKGHNLMSFIDGMKSQDYRRSMNTNKIRDLGWKPHMKFKDGIINTVEWFNNNQWFIK